MMSIKIIQIQKNQRGVVLVVTLLLLLVMTVIGLASMKTSTLEEKMAGNLFDHSLAFEAAESALRDAESWLDEMSGISDFNDETGLYQKDENTDFTEWTADNSVEYKKSKPSGVSKKPRYIIRHMDDISDTKGDLSLGQYGKLGSMPDINGV